MQSELCVWCCVGSNHFSVGLTGICLCFRLRTSCRSPRMDRCGALHRPIIPVRLQPGALSCGNAPQIVSSATFGPFCSAIQTQATCTAQCGPIACRCTWLNSHCTPPPPPAPPPPAPPAPPKPPQHGYTVGEAKFYGTNLLCELDAPNGESFHKQISANISLLQLLYFVGSMQ